MRKPIKICVVIVLLLVVLGALAGGGYVYFLKLHWSRVGAVQSTPKEWLKHWVLTPSVIRNMPMPGLVGDPWFQYYCEGDNIEENRLVFFTALSREDFLKEVEAYLEKNGYQKDGPQYVSGDNSIHIELTRSASSPTVYPIQSSTSAPAASSQPAAGSARTSQPSTVPVSYLKVQVFMQRKK